MKVAQINSVCMGSTGNICKSISGYLQEQHVENRIFYGVGGSAYPYAERFGNDMSVRMHQLRTRLDGRHAFYSGYATRDLIGRLERFRPDIVHLHNIHGHYLHAGMLFAYLREKDIRVAWTFHDCWPMTGHCAHFAYIGCTRWQSGCHDCPQLHTYPVTWLRDPSPWNYGKKKELFTSIEDMRVVVVSDWMKERAEQSFFRNHAITRIYNGVDMEQFHPQAGDVSAQYNPERKFVILGIAGKWLDEKNINFFKCMCDHLEDDMLLMLVGGGNGSGIPQYKNILSVPAADTPEGMAAYYTAADVFVNLSLEDSFGLVNAEAMACGTPVIAVAGTASEEVVGHDGTCGMVIDRADADTLPRAVKAVKEKGKQTFSGSCVKRVRDTFLSADSCKQYYALYEAMIKGGIPEK